MLAEARTWLEPSGVTFAGRPGWASHLGSLRDPEGNDLTEETHRNCPGHAAFLELEWVRPATAAENDQNGEDDEDGNEPVAVPVYVCVAPDANEHVCKYPAPAARPQAAADPDAAKAERRTVIQNNKEWRAAETVRRQWLTALLARKSPPQGASLRAGRAGRFWCLQNGKAPVALCREGWTGPLGPRSRRSDCMAKLLWWWW